MPLSFKQLCDHFQVKQGAALKRLLKERGISFILDKDGHPTTTEMALDRAMQAQKRIIKFTKPCKKIDRYRQASGKNTVPGTTSKSTSGQNYAE